MQRGLFLRVVIQVLFGVVAAGLLINLGSSSLPSWMSRPWFVWPALVVVVGILVTLHIVPTTSTVSASRRRRVGFQFPHSKLFALPRPIISYVLTIDLAAVAVVATTATLVPVTPQHWLWAGMLTAGTVIHLVVAQGFERLRKLPPPGTPEVEVQSVWMVAGILLLPPPLLAGLIMLRAVCSWAVSRNRSPIHRKVFSAATAVLGCAAASGVLEALRQGDGRYPLVLHGPVGLIAVLAAGGLYWLVNYALVVGAILLSDPTVAGRRALGNASNQLMAAASIGFGALVSVVVIVQPWWMPLVFVTVAALQFGLLRPRFRSAESAEDAAHHDTVVTQ